MFYLVLTWFYKIKETPTFTFKIQTDGTWHLLLCTPSFNSRTQFTPVLETPWKRQITAPEAATDYYLSTRIWSVAERYFLAPQIMCVRGAENSSVSKSFVSFHIWNISATAEYHGFTLGGNNFLRRSSYLHSLQQKFLRMPDLQLKGYGTMPLLYTWYS